MSTQTKRLVGIVKWYDHGEGHGFIARKQGPDVYVHISDIVSASDGQLLKVGDAVEFSVIEGDDGLQAKDVLILT